MMLYNVWVTLYSGSAKNAGIIGDVRAVKGDWSTGKLRWVPRDNYSQINYLFTARDDQSAYAEVTKLFLQTHPRERRPLAGKSYMRTCRVVDRTVGRSAYVKVEAQ